MPSSASVGAERQLVVEEGGTAVVEERLDDDEAAAASLHLPVGLARGAQPLDATDLEVGEVGRVVDVALGVDLGVADPDFGLVDYLPSNSACASRRRRSCLRGRPRWRRAGRTGPTRTPGRSEIDVQCPVRGGLGVPDGEGGVLGDLRRHLSSRVNASPCRRRGWRARSHCASSAPMRRPVKMSSLARAGPIRRGSRCVPPRPGRMPRLTSGKPNSRVLGGDAYVAGERHLAAPAQGEAVHGGYRRDGAPVEEGHRGVPDLREALRLQGSIMLIARISAPAIKARSPAPVTMIARGASTSNSRSACPISSTTCPSRAFNFS